MTLNKKTANTRISDQLFVGCFSPFVGRIHSVAVPSVCKKQPPVVFDVFYRGFTLVELLVTLVVASILMALAAPAMTKLVASNRLTSQANDLLGDLAFSRGEAIKRAAQVTICKTLDPNVAAPACDATGANAWTPGRLIFVDGNGDGIVDPADQVLRIRQLLEGAGSSGGNTLLGDGQALGTANRIVFQVNGATSLTAESELLVCDKRGDANAVAVAIHPLGRARVTAKGKDKNGNNITACP